MRVGRQPIVFILRSVCSNKLGYNKFNIRYLTSPPPHLQKHNLTCNFSCSYKNKQTNKWSSYGKSYFGIKMVLDHDGLFNSHFRGFSVYSQRLSKEDKQIPNLKQELKSWTSLVGNFRQMSKSLKQTNLFPLILLATFLVFKVRYFSKCLTKLKLVP